MLLLTASTKIRYRIMLKLFLRSEMFTVIKVTEAAEKE